MEVYLSLAGLPFTTSCLTTDINFCLLSILQFINLVQILYYVEQFNYSYFIIYSIRIINTFAFIVCVIIVLS